MDSATQFSTFDRRPSFHVSGRLTDTGGVTVSSIHRLESRRRFGSSDIHLVLLDAEHRELARSGIEFHMIHAVAPFSDSWRPEDPLGCTSWITRDFSASVPALDDGVTLALMRGTDVLWTRPAENWREGR